MVAPEGVQGFKLQVRHRAGQPKAARHPGRYLRLIKNERIFRDRILNPLEMTHEFGPVSAEVCPKINDEAKRNEVAILQRGRLSG